MKRVDTGTQNTKLIYIGQAAQRKENKMYTIEQLESLIQNAYDQRRRAYKVRAPRFVIQAINSQIRDLTADLVKMENA